MNLEQQLESLLYYKSEPQSIKSLTKELSVSESDILAGLDALRVSLRARGIVLVQSEDEVSLGTHPDSNELIDKLAKDEISGDLSKAALEALTLVLYYGPISRSELDYIRGVNSSFILRNLLVRGLVTRAKDKEDQRAMQYKPTNELLQYLGLTSVSELPNFTEVQMERAAIEEASQDDAEPEQAIQ